MIRCFDTIRAKTRKAALLLKWRNFRALLQIGLDEDPWQSLLEEPGHMPVTALLLACSGAAEFNPSAWPKARDPHVDPIHLIF